MSLLRNLSLFAMAICGVATVIAILVCWILDKPLYMSNSKKRIESLESEYGIGSEGEGGESAEGSGSEGSDEGIEDETA